MLRLHDVDARLAGFAGAMHRFTLRRRRGEDAGLAPVEADENDDADGAGNEQRRSWSTGEEEAETRCFGRQNHCG